MLVTFFLPAKFNGLNKEEKDMKRIINGKKYNTETAQKMGGRDNGYNESLYRKKTGEFFLHSEGGELSQGEKIIPLTEIEAVEWAGDHLEVDVYESIFGEVRENSSDKTVNLTIMAESHEILRRLQTRTWRSMGEIVNELVLAEGEKYNLRRKKR